MESTELTIGVMGGARNTTPKQEEASFLLGKTIAEKRCVLLTGATTGLPYSATKGAKSVGGTVVGISPAKSEEEHLAMGLPIDNLDEIDYTGLGFIGRNMLNIKRSNALVFVAGHIGTLNEFTVAFEAKKPIGILTGVGGISEKLKELVDALGKEDRKIIYDDKPSNLIEQLISLLGE